MYAFDTNILVYAHNLASPRHKKAKMFVERTISEEDQDGNPVVSIPLQVYAEFISVCTKQAVGKRLSIAEAIDIIKKYSEFLELPIIYPKPTQLQTFLSLLESTKTRKKIFDVFLAATLKDNNIEGLYTVNASDFKEFTFLKVENPLI
ncbi:MAG: type II toxin-antitoxin system VapC family toxin [bacterium]